MKISILTIFPDFFPPTLAEGMIRAAREKERLTVETGDRSLLDDFYHVFAQNMRDLGTPVFPKAMFERALTLEPCRGRVFVVRLNDRPVAAAMALAWRDSVLVPWASSLRQYRSLCANMFLYWSMIKGAIEEGYATFDFGRSTAGGGTHQFKQQWGAEDVPLHWEYASGTRDYVPSTSTDHKAMTVAIQCWQRLPLRVANAAGPLLIRLIP